MPHYYLDIETTGLDPKIDQILTIQYQKISVHTGKSAGGYSDWVSQFLKIQWA